MTTTYSGWRDPAGTAHVRVTENRWRSALPMRRDLVNHSPTGFEWGYGGSGPAQLALALIAHATCDDARALRLHQSFKRAFVAPMPREDAWKWDREHVIALVEECEAKDRAAKEAKAREREAKACSPLSP